MNKLLLRFKLPAFIPLSKAGKDAFVAERLRLQEEMRQWCIERIGHTEEFPHWQFEGGTSYLVDGEWPEEDEVTIYDGIYIFDPEARVAFKLKYGL